MIAHFQKAVRLGDKGPSMKQSTYTAKTNGSNCQCYEKDQHVLAPCVDSMDTHNHDSFGLLLFECEKNHQ